MENRLNQMGYQLEACQSLSRPLRLFVVLFATFLLVYWFGDKTLLGFGQDRQPNVLLIMTDDQGYGDIHFNGNEMIQTPNLDRLAKQSFRLENFHVDPTCSETRSALMTGKYSMSVGVWHTIMGRSILRSDALTMAEVFRENGYRTGMFGKWHLGDNFPYRPEDRGFQKVLRHGGGGVGQTPDVWKNDYFDDVYFNDGKAEQQTGYCTDVFVDAAKEFIAESDQPFFCYIATNAAHGPYRVEERYSKPYREKGVPQVMSQFYGMITNIDENVGELLALLDEHEIAKDTIFIFMTDNGTAAGLSRPSDSESWKGYNADMRGTKGSQYEGGHRVPCFIRYPRLGITEGSSKTLTAHFDLFPTLVDLCELKWPFRIQTDGQSLRPLFDGDSASFDDRVLVVQSQRVDQPEKGRKHSVMKGKFRLVDGKELYDLAQDPGQTKNLSESQPELVSELRAAYDLWWKKAAIRINEDVALVIGAEEAPQVYLTCHDWHAPQGPVPWNQTHIARDIPSNGQWAIEVVRPGTYEITLATRPPGFEIPLCKKGGSVQLQIGEQAWTKDFDSEQKSVNFQVSLEAGKTNLKSVISCNDSKETRGAYFATIEGPVDGEPTTLNRLSFEPNDTVTFVGDSFVRNLPANNYVEIFLLGLNPQTPINVHYVAIDSEQTLFSLFQNENSTEAIDDFVCQLQAHKSSHIILTFGHQDAKQRIASSEFLKAYSQLLDRTKTLNAELIVVSPHRAEQKDVSFEDIRSTNQLLKEYGQGLRELAAANDAFFVDFYEPLSSPKYLADYVPVIRDRLTEDDVLLNTYGYWRTAPTLITRLGLAHHAMGIDADFQSQKMKVIHGTLSKSSFEKSADAESPLISWTVTPEQIPMPGPPDSTPRGGRMMASHDRISIKNLPEGFYGLSIDGKPTVVADQDGWALGVYVLLGEAIPELERLREILSKKYQLQKSLTASTSDEQAKLSSELQESCNEIKKLIQPREIQFEIRRVHPDDQE